MPTTTYVIAGYADKGKRIAHILMIEDAQCFDGMFEPLIETTTDTINEKVEQCVKHITENTTTDEKIVIIGHSFGCMIVEKVVARVGPHRCYPILIDPIGWYHFTSGFEEYRDKINAVFRRHSLPLVYPDTATCDHVKELIMELYKTLPYVEYDKSLYILPKEPEHRPCSDFRPMVGSIIYDSGYHNAIIRSAKKWVFLWTAHL